MTWTYEQRTGRLSHNGEPIETGYAGNGAGYNNPDMQGTRDVGPVPQGHWTIGPVKEDGGRMGPHVLPLTPADGTDALGRDAFFIHGDRISGPPHTASDGCIIMSRGTRNDISDSGDTDLEVVAG